MNQGRHSEAAFETVIEAHLLQNGYVPVVREGFHRERAIFSESVLAAVRQTASGESRRRRLWALHREKAGEQILGDLCKWMDQNGSLAILRHGFKCFARTPHSAFMPTCANRFDARENLRDRLGGQR